MDVNLIICYCWLERGT